MTFELKYLFVTYKLNYWRISNKIEKHERCDEFFGITKYKINISSVNVIEKILQSDEIWHMTIIIYDVIIKY